MGIKVHGNLMKQESILTDYIRPLYPLFILIAIFWVLEGLDLTILRFLQLDNYGIHPREFSSLQNIFFAPLLHAGFQHVAANSVPFLVLGAFIMWRSQREFWLVTLWVAIIAGLGTWLIGGANSVHIGASGLVFGYFGFLLLLGWFERSPTSILRAVMIAFLYGGLIWGVLPGEQGISWQGHLFGFVGGVLSAYWLARIKKDSFDDTFSDKIRIG
ncbi:MAG: membrane associated rhomboid family serine protease [Cellvibrionaceae bacterium]|jgi:membrane associated rhomboid family serine protease